ncbi:MAG TPA: hypothetical protein VHD88_05295 [Pyrinomonadaceae bacterium]|nr:hypothetical protein [Pyrinomonadaceae bacterium]
MVSDSSASASPEQTPATPTVESGKRELPTTQGHGGLGGKATWSPSQDQIAEIQQYVAASAATATSRRKTWPWVVAILAILFVIIATLVWVLSNRVR